MGDDPDLNLSADLRDQDWNFDPNEPRYCICNQVSYGDMVACDNEDCPYEWFHYPCVGVTAPPKVSQLHLCNPITQNICLYTLLCFLLYFTVLYCTVLYC